MYRSKYHSKKIVVNGEKFDSKKEYQRWLQLKAMEEMGDIYGLKRQVPFVLIPSQKIDNKVVERAITYRADFEYYYKGSRIVEDVKGMKTPEYIIKRKLMLYIHGIRIQES